MGEAQLNGAKKTACFDFCIFGHGSVLNLRGFEVVTCSYQHRLLVVGKA